MKIGVLEMYLSIETREKLMIFPAKFTFFPIGFFRFNLGWDGHPKKWVDTRYSNWRILGLKDVGD